MKKWIPVLFFIILVMLSGCTKEQAALFYPADQDVILRNIGYGDHPQQNMDVYLPANRSADRTKLLVYVHGGNWSAGDKDELAIDDQLVSFLRENLPDYALFSLNYRLSENGNHMHPSAEEDIMHAMDYIHERAPSYQISADTYIAGMDSGAQLAALYAVKSVSHSARLKGCIAISGAFDLRALYHHGDDQVRQMLQGYLGGSPSEVASRYRDASPIHFITPETPPFLIIHGIADDTFPFGQASDFMHKLQAQDIDCTVMRHPGGHHHISPMDMGKAITQIKAFLL